MVFLSKSSLSTYLVCPKLYKFLYIDKLPLGTKSPAAQRGLDLHQFAYDFYDHVTVTGSIFYIDPTWLKEQLIIATEDAKPFMENFLEMEKQRWKLCVEHDSKHPEKYFYPVLREQKIQNLGLEITGIVDRVDLNFDKKTYTVIDYKTEKFDQRPWKLTEHRREMAFYKLLLETSGLLDGKITHFCIYYPRSNNVWCEQFTWRTINALEKKMQEVREGILAERFPCNISLFCRWCDANTMCPMEV